MTDSARHSMKTSKPLGAVGFVLLLFFAAQLAFLVKTLSPLALSLWRGEAQEVPFLLLAAQTVGFFATCALIWRLYLAAVYRPVPGASDAELPLLTVIVPAYNEGRQVYATLRSLVQSDYPADKLQIIAVNDGSVDDTWHWMETAFNQFPDQVIALNCRVNRGKRAALYEGFNRARGSVIVTVDSDSEVLADTLRNMVSPFLRDERVGAVAGNVRVLNVKEGMIPAMLDVSFTYSFEFMRSSESQVDTVVCCPGALSAYRRDIVELVKDEWANQTFFGRPANIGEDRALTNLILKMGYLVRFQSNAIVLTEVPTNIRQLSKMFLRWARSDVRESLVLSRFIFTPFRESSAWGARLNFSLAFARLLLMPFLFVTGLFSLALQPALLPWILLGGLIAGIPSTLVFLGTRASRAGFWGLLYGVFFTLCLSWIAPFGLFTAHRSGWLTRQLKAPEQKAPALPLPGPARASLSTQETLIAS